MTCITIGADRRLRSDPQCPRIAAETRGDDKPQLTLKVKAPRRGTDKLAIKRVGTRASQDTDLGGALLAPDGVGAIDETVTFPMAASVWTTIAVREWFSSRQGRRPRAAGHRIDPTGQQDAVRVLVAIVDAVIAVGDITGAEALAHTITESRQRDQALTNVLQAMTTAGNIAGAEALAPSIASPYRRANALVALAHALGLQHQFVRARSVAADAEALARRLPDIDQQARVLTSLVGALAASRDVTRAETVASTIADPRRQATALTQLALHGNSGDARRALNRVIFTDDWTAILTILPIIQPGIMAAAADDLLSGHSSRDPA